MRKGYVAIGHFWRGVGFLCLIVGIASEVLNQELGLEWASWFQLGIGFLIISVIHYILWSVEVKKTQ